MVAGINPRKREFMSCIVLSDYHISAVVAWAVRQGLDLDTSPDAIAHMLASANRRAYSDRYAGRYDSELVPFGGLDRSAGADLAPVAIVKACDALDYQASDWARWTDSDAFGYMVAIRRAAVAMAAPAGNPSAPGRSLPGYDAAAWTLDPPDAWTPDPMLAVNRLAAALGDMSEPELAAIRSAMLAVAADRRAAELAGGAA
jgi:hypothetical protein